MGPAAALDGEANEPPALVERSEPLALLEAVDRDGLVRQSWRIEHWPVSIGRALDNTVVLSDPHVAPHHATLDVANGAAGATTITVSAGATRNGVAVGREHVPGGASKAIADSGRDLELHVGRAQLRLRLPGHALGPEQAMTPVVASERRWLPTFGLALAVLAVVLANTWIDTDPDALARAAGATVLTTIAGGAIWCGLWALLSKTFTRQSHLGWHVRVFVIASLVTLALAVLPPLLAFAFSWPWVTDFSFVAVYATVAAAIYFHLLAVEPARERLMRAVAATGFVVGVALSLWFNVQRTGRPGEELYMNHLFPPQLRIAKPKPVDSFIEGLAPMQTILDRKAKEQTGGDGDSRGGDDEE
jgi:MFS family permease